MGDLEAHGAAALAPAQLLLDRLQEVVGLVLVDREVEVARDAEGAAADHAEPRKELAGVHGDEILEQREGELSGPRRRGDAREHRRHLHDGDHRLAPRDLLALADMQIARLRLRLRSCGKGWPGSTASGVRTGKTSCAK